MRIYNSMKQSTEEFVPLESGKVSMYVCGPTVYDRGHLGHGRSAVAFDIVRRYLIYKGYEVNFVMNITDIDDKMIKRAAERDITVAELAALVTPQYMEDYGMLGVMPATAYPNATDYIDGMVEMIKKLEDAGHTYVLDDGVYFDVTSSPEYGKLSGQKLDQLEDGARVEVKVEKKNPQDFVLWKFEKPDEPSWDAPWGKGRPGWHIECSVMSWKCLGEKFDIHGGGLDLKFPHHECEIAQTEGCFGPGSFAQYWLHNGFINVDSEKMSKSLNNFFTLEDAFVRFHPQVIRMFYLGTHYRSPINYSEESLNHAKAALARLHGFVKNNVSSYDSLPDEAENDFDAAEYVIAFEKAMDEDFNTSGALASVFDLVKAVNTLRDDGKLSKKDLDAVESFLKKADEVLMVIFAKEEDVDSDVEDLIKQRDEARANKDFARSDEIRDELKGRGIELEDSPDGTIWKRVL